MAHNKVAVLLEFAIFTTSNTDHVSVVKIGPPLHNGSYSLVSGSRTDFT